MILFDIVAANISNIFSLDSYFIPNFPICPFLRTKNIYPVCFIKLWPFSNRGIISSCILSNIYIVSSTSSNKRIFRSSRGRVEFIWCYNTRLVNPSSIFICDPNLISVSRLINNIYKITTIQFWICTKLIIACFRCVYDCIIGCASSNEGFKA